jgi:hypothetical protein
MRDERSGTDGYTQECIQLAFISHWEWCSGLMDEVVSDRWCPST